MSRYIDQVGKTYGMLTVEKSLGVDKGRRMVWQCKCTCGNITTAVTGHLKSGSRTSCGCSKKTHGMRHTRIYQTYRGILQRCNDKNHHSYKDYGGRGIMCLWKSFEEFYEDMKEGYSDTLTIDRIDNNGNYCKGNCRWINAKQQANNTRRNVYLEFNGKTQSLTLWAEELNIKYFMLRQRVERGWSVERALTTKPFNRGQKQ